MKGTLEFWFRRKYMLAPTDPRFLEATIEDMESDYWAWHYTEKPDSTEEYEDDDFDLEKILEEDDFEDITQLITGQDNG